MTWTVTKAGTGTAQYSHVKVVEGGALECYVWGSTRLGGPGNVVGAYYGPGMWVSAVKDKS